MRLVGRLVVGMLALLPMRAMAEEAGAPKSVLVTQIVEHPALDADRKGIQDALDAAGFKVGTTLKFQFQSAQGNPAVAAQIARQFVGEGPDVIVAISTPSAQAVAAATKTIPLVFSAVTDPLGAQLVKDSNHPGGTVTGVSDLSPIAEHLALVKEITPDVKRLGIVYNPGEANSVTLVRLLKELSPTQGLTIVETTAAKSADVQAAARNLVGKVDAIYLPTDNTVISALGAVLAVGAQNKLPIYAGDTDSVAQGALASIGFDYYQVGRQTGEIVARILKGEKPGDIAVVPARGTDLMVNLKTAEAEGVTVPATVIARAAKVIR